MKTVPAVDVDYDGAEVRYCKDGKYRWKYELNLITNPIVAITTFKVFFYVILAGFLFFGTILYAIHGDWKGLWDFAKIALLVMGIFAGLTIIGTLVIALLYGGKYVVLFEMNEDTVAHIQLPVQAEKARKIGFITFLVGLMARRPTTAGAGMLATVKNSSTSVFANVKRVQRRKLFHTIKVNMLLDHNQIYVPDEDYEFVYDYIKRHCPKVK